MNNDTLRRGSNLVLALLQPIIAAIAFANGFDTEMAKQGETEKTLIEPAGYAFIIWSVIFGGTIAYAIYQALPAQKETPLFRRIGTATASAFLSVNIWLLSARFGWIWLTVACIIWMLISLAFPFREFLRSSRTLTLSQKVYVVFPFSVFLGWVSIAVYANTAAALKVSGFFPDESGELMWTLAMMIAAGIGGSIVTYRSRGNVPYGLTLIWALVGIVMADRMREITTAITPLGLSLALVVVLVMLAARFGGKSFSSPFARE
jgi:hypothetical protein